MSKAEARIALDEILAPLNRKPEPCAGEMDLSTFVEQVYFPFNRRKWKGSSRVTTESRINAHVMLEFGKRPIRVIDREALQALLDRKAAAGLSWSLIQHLRWDLRHIFRFAVAEGLADRNPAEMLFTPRNATRAPKRVAAAQDLVKAFAVVELRERLILKLAGIAGMRPGEIFALRWSDFDGRYASIERRIYEGEIDTPKSYKSIRRAAFSQSVATDLDEWRALCPDVSPGAWVFPSETGKTPVRRGNIWRRCIGPKLVEAGLGWINFQVLRRTCSSLLNDLGIEGKVVADQLGHTLDVNQNVYTHAAGSRREDAVNRLDSALLVN
jgi:integrase